MTESRALTVEQVAIIERALSDAYDDRMSYAASGAGEGSEVARRQADEYATVLREVFGTLPEALKLAKLAKQSRATRLTEIKPNSKTDT